MRWRTRWKLAVLLAAAPVSLWAGDHFFLIGGGAAPASSEAQIEFNVKWVLASLDAMFPDAPVTVWYAGGRNPPPNTVVELVPPHDTTVPHQALAAVYDFTIENRLRYRAHTVTPVAGTTERDSLVTALGAHLAKLRQGDQAFVLYNGHGSWAPDRRDNALRLWNNSLLSVREFEGLLSRVDRQVPVRFVMTQCYSGAFARAIHDQAIESLTLAPGNRCGFFAESAERESEGCSASVSLGDYRDYTTYFFSGLSGRDRLGRAVPVAADRDGDGRVSPFDAHLYTLIEGYNGDLPRSTSEDYLERAHPWYLRWIGTARLPDNVYGRLAHDMAVRYGLPTEGAPVGRALRGRYDSLQVEVMRTAQQRDALDVAAQQTRASILARVTPRHPQLARVDTSDLSALLAVATPQVEADLRADTAFATLLRQEQALEALDLQLIDLDRRVSQLDRLRRTRLMARALGQLARHGTPAVRASYTQLRRCEALPLGR